ncbi:putative helicase [Gregarina niphandrodes]|uniref:Helicase n=1 Tax=Gregarina niphandrodes TaxID=110365 RepID=A0A023B0S8_GRENI|nr:putative helicase [Gregarina niphandrodes]EZG45863.1 putative helicase [Gregarina niphandrodes]|eukprot:XP_011132435.1 putative helicase [Gregarina niphandrodes]
MSTSPATDVIRVGKYKGKHFNEIEDNSYKQWVLSLQDCSGSLLAFQTWLKEKSNTGDGPEGRKRFASELATAHGDLAPAPAYNKRSRLSEFLDDDMDELLVFDAPDKGEVITSPTKTSFEVRGSLDGRASLERRGSLDGRGSLDILQDELDECGIKRDWDEGGQGGSHGRGGGGSQSRGGMLESSSEPVVTFNGKMVLEVATPQHFRLLLLESGRKGYSTFLPSPLWNLLCRYRTVPGGQSGENLPGGVLIDQDNYDEVAKLLAAKVRGAQLETIPSFVQLCFPGLRPCAPSTRLPVRSANIICGLNSPKTREVVESTRDLHGRIGVLLMRELKPFQVEGVIWGVSRNGRCLIGDEMGLGKTLQALSIVAVYHDEWPVLVVCPSSIRFQWKDQAKRWLGHCFSKPDDEIVVVRNGRTSIPTGARMIITSYELLVRADCLKHGFKVIICDESHYLKNINAKRSRTLVPMLQTAKRAILLSGTPALNNPIELYQQFNAVVPDVVKYDVFANRYCEKKRNPWSKRMEYSGAKLPLELNVLLTQSIMIRRLKKDVQKELPEKLRSCIPVETDQAIVGKIQELLESSKKQVEVSPETDQERPWPEQNVIGEAFRLTGEAKVNAVCDYLDYMLTVEPRFLVFAHHRVVMDALELRLKQHKASYIRVDGSTPQNQRDGLIRKFQEEKKADVALLSITACGHGLNLTTVNTAVFAELYWVPGQMIQAEDRIHRMGSTYSTVNVHYCIAENTLDDTVWKTLIRKWEGVTTTLNGVREQLAFDNHFGEEPIF